MAEVNGYRRTQSASRVGGRQTRAKQSSRSKETSIAKQQAMKQINVRLAVIRSKVELLKDKPAPKSSIRLILQCQLECLKKQLQLRHQEKLMLQQKRHSLEMTLQKIGQQTIMAEKQLDVKRGGGGCGGKCAVKDNQHLVKLNAQIKQDQERLVQIEGGISKVLEEVSLLKQLNYSQADTQLKFSRFKTPKPRITS